MANESQNKDAVPFSEARHSHVGPILGVLIVILIIILGGLYLWGSMLEEEESLTPVERTLPNNEPETTRAQADRQIMDTTSSSNDLDAIYADLESTNLNDLDADLTQIDAEMNASLR